MKDKQILVVGSGIMGRGIAYVAAVGGYEVILNDVKPDVLDDAKSDIDRLFETGLERGKLTEKDIANAKERMSFDSDLEKSAQNADFAIEAVPEDIQIKGSIFEKLDKLTPKHSILATNTSTMSPTEIGSYTDRPGQVIAMHFFNPVPKMKLVEIINGLETAEDTSAVTRQVAEKMGKETVVVEEFPGFVTSRMSSLVGNEAFHMLMEGVGTPEDIDRAIEVGLNYPMGPFKLGDLVGLDTRLRNLNYLYENLGERFRPSPLLVKYVKSGRLGKKTGKGVYDYT